MKKILLFFVATNIAFLLTANYDATLNKLTNYIQKLANDKYAGFIAIDAPRKITSINEIGVVPKDPILLTLNERTANALGTSRIIRIVRLVARDGFQRAKKDFLIDIDTFIRTTLQPEHEVELYAMSYTKRTSQPESRVLARMQAIEDREPLDIYYKVREYGY